MQPLKLFSAAIISVMIFLACSSNTSGNNSSKDSSSESAATSNNSSNGASFSAAIDGTVITGNGIDEMQLRNTAFIYPGADDNSKRLLFFLYSTKNGSDDKPDYSFRFSVPDKEGSFTKNIRDDQPYDITLDFLNGDHSRYGAEAVTINITSITASRIAGVFSGKFILSNDTPNGKKKEVTITDGKFDIPFSTGNIKPE